MAAKASEGGEGEGGQKLAEKGEELKEEMDNLLDEIDYGPRRECRRVRQELRPARRRVASLLRRSGTEVAVRG